MLDFYFILDEQPNNTPSTQLKYAGGIEDEEFEIAQQVGVIEDSADYYGKFRWTSEQVKAKAHLLASCPFRASISLNGILNQAQADGMGLRAFGD